MVVILGIGITVMFFKLFPNFSLFDFLPQESHAYIMWTKIKLSKVGNKRTMMSNTQFCVFSILMQPQMFIEMCCLHRKYIS